MVELALVLPIFLLIVMATVDFGWAFRSYIVATNAAREGARVGITGANEATIEAAVVDKAVGVLEADEVTVTNALGASGENLTVNATFDYEFITPLGSLLSLVSGDAVGGDSLTIETETVMRLE
jgi:Flp pilus assembly protein TadG